MNILLISYFFPPDQRVGGYRPYSFAKQLPDFDVNVTVLTSIEENQKNTIIDDLNVKDIYCAKKTNLRELGYKTKILALLELLKLDKLFLFPDPYFPWIRRATKLGKKILKKQKIDAILVTGPPFSTFLVGYNLSKKYNIPLILDYRDPWLGNPFDDYSFNFLEKRVKKNEKRIIEQADMLITVGNEYAELIADNINIDPSEFNIVFNGYFAKDKKERDIKKLEKVFTISFFGNFYLIQKQVVADFLVGLGKMIKNNGLKPSDIQFKYAGKTSRKVLSRMLRDAEINDYFVDLGFLKKEDLMKEITKSHLLLDIVPEGTEYMIHTKIYDYFLGDSHIILVGKKGSIVTLCDDIEQEYTSVSQNISEIKQKLTDLYQKWQTKELKFGCNEEKLTKYSRRNQAKKLVNILKKQYSS